MKNENMKGNRIWEVSARFLLRMTRAYMNADGNGSSDKEKSLTMQEDVGGCGRMCVKKKWEIHF